MEITNKKKDVCIQEDWKYRLKKNVYQENYKKIFLFLYYLVRI